MTSSRRMTQRAICGAAMAGLAALVTACGSATPGAAPAKTAKAAKTGRPATTTPTQTTTASPSSPSPTRTAATGPGPGPAGTPAACASRYLRASVGATQGTAGSLYATINFTNLGRTSCTLYGYPGVSLAAGQPVTQVGLAAAENGSTPRELVTLKPGGIANALLRVVDAGNFSAAQCHRVPVTWLQIFPPNQTTPLYVRFPTTTCAKPVQILTVDAVRPG